MLARSRRVGNTRTMVLVNSMWSAVKALLLDALTILAVAGLISAILGALWLVAQVMRFLGPLVLGAPYWLMVPGILYLLCYLPPIRRITRRMVRALS